MIDIHAHLGKWFNFHYDSGDYLSMLKLMDKIGIEYAWISALISIGPDYKLGNEMVLEAIRAYPNRFKGYVTLSPYFPQEMKEELTLRFSQGFIGIKLHPDTHSYPLEEENYLPAYEFANQIGCPVLIHVWGERPVRALGELAKSYPNVTFIMGHSGGDLKAMMLAPEIVIQNENIYLDLTGSAMYRGIIEYFVERVGSEKVLLGTDFPFIDPRPAIGWVKSSNISDRDKENIMYRNAKRILERRENL